MLRPSVVPLESAVRDNAHRRCRAEGHFGTDGSVACPAGAAAKADSNPLAPTTFLKISLADRPCLR